MRLLLIILLISACDSNLRVVSQGGECLRPDDPQCASSPPPEEVASPSPEDAPPPSPQEIVTPVFTSLLAVHAADDGYVNLQEKDTIDAAFALVAEKYETADYTQVLADGTLTCDANQIYDQTSIPRIDEIPGANGLYAVCVRLTSSTQTVVYGKSQSIVKDTTPPTFTSFNAIEEAEDLYINASEAAINSSAFSLAGVSGAFSVSYTSALVDSPAITCDENMSYAANGEPLISSFPAAETAYAVCAKLVDAAGNVVYGKSQTVVKDLTPPTVTLSNLPASGDNQYVQVSVSGTGNPTHFRPLIGSTSTLTNCDSGGSGYSAEMAISTPLSGAVTDGRHRLCVIARDAAGNYSSTATAATHTWFVSTKSYAAMQIDARSGFTCATMADGRVKCFGINSYSTLGNSDVNHRGDQAGEMGDNLPAVSFPSGLHATQVVTGERFACALLADHSVNCWGHSASGAEGFGGTAGSIRPIDLGTGRTARQLAASSIHVCALLDDYTIKCWGSNFYGSLGYGDTTDRGDSAATQGDNLPIVAIGATGTKAKAIFAGGDATTCAILFDNTLKCWGKNTNGITGHLKTNFNIGDQAGEMGASLATISLGANRKVRQVAIGFEHICAIANMYQLKCWGANTHGELGQENTTIIDENGITGAAFINLGTNRYARKVVAGENFTCVLLDNYTVKCWGRNHKGQLGKGHKDSLGDAASEMGDNLTPVDVGTGRSVVDITASRDHVCVSLPINPA